MKNHRDDVDGLRAYAVMAVLLYHLGFTIFRGGFVGVDIFFVISGFVITRMIRQQVEAGEFTFSNFYYRRIKRLLPAFAMVLVATTIASAFLLAPDDLSDFASSAEWTLISASNVFFWLNSGYFDAASSTRPLLHTWSIAVEEQFYLIWPAAIVLTMKLKPKAVLYVVGIVGVVSLIACEFVLSRDSDAAFYLTPFRMFEFAIGAALVWVSTKRFAEIACLIGLAVTAYSVHYYQAEMRFPGWSAVLPCIGTALVIYGGEARYAGYLFRNPVAVWLGRISYSIYLIHWPLIVLYGYWKFYPITGWEKVGLAIATIILASLSYVVVEQPLRRARVSLRKVFAGAIACVVALAVPTVSAASTGWPWRFDISATAYIEPIENQIAGRTKEVEARTYPKRVVFIGDSVINGFFDAFLLSEQFKKYSSYRLEKYGMGGCRPLPGPSLSYSAGTPQAAECEAYFNKVYADLGSPDVIFLDGHWGGVPARDEQVKKRLSELIDNLVATTKATIVLVDYSPLYDRSVRDALPMLYRMDADGFNAEMQKMRAKDTEDEFDKFQRTLDAKYDRVQFLATKDYFCDELCPVFLDGHFIVRDRIHLTSAGKVRMAGAIDRAMQGLP